jgi:hypothetical protein
MDPAAPPTCPLVPFDGVLSDLRGGAALAVIRTAAMPELATAIAAIPEARLLGAPAHDRVAILLPDQSAVGAVILLTTAMRRLRTPWAVGIAALPEHPAHELYAAADAALSEALASGRAVATAG